MENFENYHDKKSDRLTEGFRELRYAENVEQSIFNGLEEVLTESNFKLADTTDLSEIFYNNTLICRSESLSRVTDLLTEDAPLVLVNEDTCANMCSMTSGDGFKVAMTEGFSTRDVAGVVKTVITFRGTHLTSREHVSSTDPLWEMKPETARVSLVGRGEVHLDDIAMISFRFPVHLFPQEKITETERENLEVGGIQFIVRHYIPDNKKTTH